MPISNATAESPAGFSTPCPGCGHLAPPPGSSQVALLDAQKQIRDLQAQVRLLSQKTAACAPNVVDGAKDHTQPALPAALDPRPPTPGTARPSFLSVSSVAGRGFSALLLGGRQTALTPAPSPPATSALSGQPSPFSPAVTSPVTTPLTPPPVSSPNGEDERHPAAANLSAQDLMQALSHEKSLRRAAEGKLDDTSREVEELSAQLFEQANEMVAAERRARAELELRVETLERRDVDKRRRLDRLEAAMGRIDRVRTLLDENPRPASFSRPPTGNARSDDIDDDCDDSANGNRHSQASKRGSAASAASALAASVMAAARKGLKSAGG